MQTCEIQDVILTKNLKEIDISQNIISIILEESVSKKIIDGILIFHDEQKIFETYSLNGDETVKISLNDLLNDTKITLEFAITSNVSINNPNIDSQNLALEIIDLQYFKFIKEYSASFANQPISDFIQTFSTTILNKEITNIEQSKGKYSVAFPYLKFHYILSYLNQYLVSVNNYNNYFYFSSLFNGTFFSSLQNLIKKVSNKMIFQENINNQLGISINDFQNYKLDNTWNIKNTLLNKQGSSKVQYYNYNTGSLNERIITYSNLIKNQKLLGKFSMYSDKIMDQNTFVYYSSTINNKNEDLIEQGLFSTSCNIISFETDGDTERNCGSTCKLLFEDKNTNEIFNVTKSGTYFITKIKHIFLRNNYRQQITCLKNAMNYKTSLNQIEIVNGIE